MLKDNEMAVDSLMRNVVEHNLLCYEAGKAIFCPACQNIMDWRSTVVATLHATKDGKEEIVRKYVQCAKCFDKRKQGLIDGITSANAKLASKGIKAHLETIDGRDKRFDDVE